jgi:heme/copper-type cytochrome/quinol oxidase subunit 4
MPAKKEKSKRGIIFWSGFTLGSILFAISLWYVVNSFSGSNDNSFASLALFPTLLFLVALILSIFSKKAGAISYGILFVLVLITSLVQGSYWVLYIIPAWLFLTGSLITISIFEK